MSDEQRAPFGQTTGGIILIQGVVTAIVSAVVTWAINNAAGLPLLSIGALFLGVGLVVFLVISLFGKRLRLAMWGWLPRLSKFLGGLRVTTSRQRDAARKLAEKHGAYLWAEETKPGLTSTLQRLSRALGENKQLKNDLDQALSEDAKNELARQVGEKRADEWEAKFTATTQAMRDLESRQGAGPALPPPDPRWAIELVDDRGDILTYEVRNLMPSSVAYNVRIETKHGGFRFGDAAFWPDLSGAASGQFSGEITAGDLGFEFVLEWLNQDQDRCTKGWHMSGNPAPF